MRLAAAALLAGLLAATAALAQDHFAHRLALFRELRALNAELLKRDSATAVLQAICDRRSPGQRIVARKAHWEAEEGAEAAVRRELGMGPAEPLRFRQVQLACGDVVFSSAENWYAPARLTPEMNRALDETQTPFGVVVAPLNFKRRRLAQTYLFEPLPEDWEKRPRSDFDAAPSPPPHVLQHRAVLMTPDGPAFSLVVENYTERVLGP